MTKLVIDDALGLISFSFSFLDQNAREQKRATREPKSFDAWMAEFRVKGVFAPAYTYCYKALLLFLLSIYTELLVEGDCDISKLREA